LRRTLVQEIFNHLFLATKALGSKLDESYVPVAITRLVDVQRKELRPAKKKHGGCIKIGVVFLSALEPWWQKPSKAPQTFTVQVSDTTMML
jgi:hypothetical protein